MFYNPFRKMWTFSIRETMRKYGRIRSYREHPDFLTSRWEKKDVHPWMWCDELDLPDPDLGYVPELYKVNCVAHESRMIAFLGIYKGPPNEIAVVHRGFPKTNDLEVAFTAMAWRGNAPTARRSSRARAGRARGIAGICTPRAASFWWWELRIYFTGFSGISPKNGTGPYAGSSTGLATLRRDGFVSMNGPGEAMRTVEPRIPGTLTTRTVTFSGRRLFVNAKVKVGALRAEVLDPAGRPDQTLHAGQLRARDVRFDEAAGGLEARRGPAGARGQAGAAPIRDDERGTLFVLGEP